LVEEIEETPFPLPLSSMSKITLMVGAVLALSVAFALLLIGRSAEGYEDEKGFHPGADGKSPEAQANEDAQVEPPNVVAKERGKSIEAKR
jgi:hypothetical protein